jgi:trehalose/maltose transport system permease protein
MTTRKATLTAVNRVVFFAVILLVAFYALFPFYWAFNTSFKSEDEMFSRATYWPHHPQLVNYDSVFKNDVFMKALLNSAFVSGSTALLAIVIGSFAAYALGRLRFKGRTLLLYAVLTMTMFPRISILSGLYAIVRDLDIFGTKFFSRVARGNRAGCTRRWCDDAANFPADLATTDRACAGYDRAAGLCNVVE